jgi:hypothetical protein
MTERTITMQKLRAILTREDRINTPIFIDVMNAAFPIPFTPKKGEIIWVRNNDQVQWIPRVFKAIENEKYKCYAVIGNTETSWSLAKPQTPTERGEG